MNPILKYISDVVEPDDPKELALNRKWATSYSVVDGKLFRIWFSMPLLKCFGPKETYYVLREIHEGICGHHPGGRSLAKKALRVGYYWPTMGEDARKLVPKCDKCQQHSDVHVAPLVELNNFTPLVLLLGGEFIY